MIAGWITLTAAGGSGGGAGKQVSIPAGWCLCWGWFWPVPAVGTGLVWSRGAKSSAERETRENAAALIETVGTEGLVSHLGRELMVRYYQVEKSGQMLGYGVSFMQPRIDGDNAWVVRGGDLFELAAEELGIESRFSVANDLSSYAYSETRRFVLDKKLHVVRQEQGMADGVWRVLIWLICSGFRCPLISSIRPT